MYQTYFGIEETPFSNTPDPRYLYMSTRHQEALAHLMYGVQEGSGFVLLTGEVGTGKTTVSRCLIEQLPDSVDLALCVNPRLNEAELLANICDELGIKTSGRTDSVKKLMDAITLHLLEVHAKGRRTVLIIDEAQNLSPLVLEQVRLLTNLETARTKLLQIILIGQPELKDLLDRKEMRQLNQRITARYHLQPLSQAEAKKYIRHRMQVGGLRASVFQAGAINVICKASHGVPRLINSISDRCLLGAYSKDTKHVDKKLARAAVKEVFGDNYKKTNGTDGRKSFPALAASIAALAVAAAVFMLVRPLDLDRFSEPNSLQADVGEGSGSPPRPSTGQAVITPRASGENLPEPSPTEGLGVADDTLTTQSQPPGNPAREARAEPAPKTPAAIDESEERGTIAPEEPVEALFRLPENPASLELAMSGLLDLWGHDNSPISPIDPCAAATKNGLECSRVEGTWASMERTNRPSMIRLANFGGKETHVVVTAIEGDTVTLETAMGRIVTKIGMVTPYWSGQYLMLKRPPAAGGRALRSGMKGKDVAWLRSHLSTILGQPFNGENPDVFDDALREQVAAFQREQKISMDGIAGSETLNRVNELMKTVSGPVLRNQP
ncbi:MAG: AAA family ATPase [Rhodospirillales bacterium]